MVTSLLDGAGIKAENREPKTEDSSPLIVPLTPFPGGNDTPAMKNLVPTRLSRASRLAAGISVFVLMMLLAGCGDDAPAPRAAASPSASADPTAAPESSPTPASTGEVQLYYDRIDSSMVEVTGWESATPAFRVVWSYWNDDTSPTGIRMVPANNVYRRDGDDILVAAHYDVDSWHGGGEAGVRYAPRVLRLREDGEGFDQVFDSLFFSGWHSESRANTPEDVFALMETERPSEGEPLPHAWMPIRDERVPALLEQLATGDPGARAGFDDLIRDRPTDPLVLLLALDNLLVTRDPTRMRTLLANEGAFLRDAGDPYLLLAANYYDLWLEMDRTSREGRNLALIERDNGGLAGLLRGRRTFPQPGMVHFNLNRPVILWHGNSTPNFLDHQIEARNAQVESIFRLFDGRPDEAFTLLERTGWLGTILVGTDLDLITHLIGVAISSITVRGFELVLLDGCRTPAQIEALWPRFDALYRGYREAAENPLVRSQGELSPLNRRTSVSPNYLEARTRLYHSLARYATLHTATAARHSYMNGVQFPADPSRIGTLLPGGADHDPFAAPGVTLRTTRGDDGAFIVYSVGPDEQDNGAAFEYDPTNGTISPGDIATRVYGIPRYPFPGPGFLPQTRDGILATFHHGLPSDPFADTRGAGLAISDTLPPVIWSFGPDTDEHEWVRRSDVPANEAPPQGVAVSRNGSLVRYLENRPIEPQYDPTNGTISNGNLYWRVGYRAR
ncbi:MAG: hypothetical protein PWP23_229 [Candidatus Sumerlaeota bacterium]|nr:hypothetical protein [Candidatus Sumerlaeota bacterium]